MNGKYLVLLSGGQDSTTCLFWAIQKFGRKNVQAFNIFYSQRHFVECESAKKIAQIAQVPYYQYNSSLLKELGESNLVKNGDISENHSINKSLPSSFLPGRNMIFLVAAAMFAYKNNISNIVTGICQTDFSGYPDCRDNSINAIQIAISLCFENDFKIHTPLMWLTKRETVWLALDLPGCIEALRWSHTCYEGIYPPCRKCPACKLREKGFNEAGIIDPLLQRVNLNE